MSINLNASKTILKGIEMQTTNKLPLREVARVIIAKNGKICLGKVIDEQGKLVCYNFPGGGIDNGDSHEETCRKEALQEVGILVGNIRPTGLAHAAEHEMGKKRAHLYRGTNNVYYAGDYEGEDKTHLNSEGDEMPYSWETPDNAIRLIQYGPANEFNEVRINAIKAFKKLGNKKLVKQTW